MDRLRAQFSGFFELPGVEDLARAQDAVVIAQVRRALGPAPALEIAWRGTDQQWRVAQSPRDKGIADRGFVRDRDVDPCLDRIDVAVADGDAAAVVRNGADRNGKGLVVNSSRGIIYADSTENFAAGAAEATKQLRDLLNQYR